jgi:hypothetical protein
MTGRNISSARKGLKPAFLKINQYGMSTMMVIIMLNKAKNVRKASECKRPNPWVVYMA